MYLRFEGKSPVGTKEGGDPQYEAKTVCRKRGLMKGRWVDLNNTHFPRGFWGKGFLLVHRRRLKKRGPGSYRDI